MNYRACIQASIDYIEEHLKDELTAEALASIAGFSVYHYSRVFHAYVGKPVMEYIAVIPNPFSSITRINFSLTEAIPVSMRVFDMLGKEVFSSPEKMYAAGTGEIEWNANGLGNGTYLCVLKIGSEMRSVRVVLDK